MFAILQQPWITFIFKDYFYFTYICDKIGWAEEEHIQQEKMYFFC